MKPPNPLYNRLEFNGVKLTLCVSVSQNGTLVNCVFPTFDITSWIIMKNSVIKEGNPKTDIEAIGEIDEPEKPEVNVDVLWTQRDNQDRWVEKISQNQERLDEVN